MFSLPFELPGFAVTQVTDDKTTVMIYASAQQAMASCPRCQQPSQSIHSYYSRSPQDLPISGKTVRLVLRVRRFRCQNPACPQRTFAERCASGRGSSCATDEAADSEHLALWWRGDESSQQHAC